MSKETKRKIAIVGKLNNTKNIKAAMKAIDEVKVEAKDAGLNKHSEEVSKMNSKAEQLAKKRKLIRSIHNPQLKYCECAMCKDETLKKVHARLKHFNKRIEKYPSQVTKEEMVEMQFLLQKVADIEEVIIASDIDSAS